MTVAVVACAGLFAGLHAASWGAYKDTPYEGFRWRSGLRSLALAAAIGGLLAVLTRVETVSSGVVLLGAVYTIERLATEWWKSIVRNDDQSAYDIPMRLGFRGRPVQSRRVRYVVGVVVVAGLLLACALAGLVQDVVELPAWATIVVGGAGGWLTAVGGAWKDAPIEGFGPLKFLRSPVVATVWAVPLSFLTDSWVVLAFSAAGFAVASIETYKTFLTGGRPPGKFATKPVRFEAHVLRRRLAGLHAGTWAGLGLVLLAGADPLLLHRIRLSDAEPGLAILMVAAYAAVAAVLVLGAVWTTGRGRPAGPVAEPVPALSSPSAAEGSEKGPAKAYDWAGRS